MVGHIKLDRKILEWEWYKDANVSRLFIHLLLIANHKDGRWQGNEVKRGQVITGLDKLSLATGLSIMQIRTCFDKLTTTSEVTVKVTNKFRVVTICKYDVYQSFKNENINQFNNQINSEVTAEQQTSNKQVTANNNDNNDNNVNNDKENNKKEDVPVIWENEKQYFFNDGKWIWKFCTDKGITVDDFDLKAKEFVSDIELKSDYKAVKELQRHFTNWYNLKNKKNGHNSELSNGRSSKQGTSAARTNALREW